MSTKSSKSTKSVKSSKSSKVVKKAPSEALKTALKSSLKTAIKSVAEKQVTEVATPQKLTKADEIAINTLPAVVTPPQVEKPVVAQDKAVSGAVVHTSTVQNPVKAFLDLASAMYAENKDVTRKEILEAVAKAGIATYTARTQYQIWKANGRK